MNRIQLILTIALCGGCVASEPELPSIAEMKAVVEANNAAFAEAFANKDVEALLGLYTTDAVVLPPYQESRIGQEALREAIRADLEIMSNLTFTSMDVEVLSEETAVDWGTYTATLMLPGSEVPTEDRGSYVVLWKKGADGLWKLHWDIWNSDVPLPGGE